MLAPEIVIPLFMAIVAIHSHFLGNRKRSDKFRFLIYVIITTVFLIGYCVTCYTGNHSLSQIWISATVGAIITESTLFIVYEVYERKIEKKMTNR
jgi:hypothetical protein